MKVLGFVNRYSRGVQAVQDELRSNGNGEADFKLHLVTAFLVIEMIALKESEEEPIKEPEKPIKEPEKPIKEPQEPIKEPIKGLRKELVDVILAIRENPNITYEKMEAKLGVKRSAIYERIKKLKALGLISRQGARSNGKWIASAIE